MKAPDLFIYHAKKAELEENMKSMSGNARTFAQCKLWALEHRLDETMNKAILDAVADLNTLNEALHLESEQED